MRLFDFLVGKNTEKGLEILNEVGATVNKSNFLFFVNEIEYIRLLIDKNGVRVNPRKIDPIKNMPQSTNVKQLQSFWRQSAITRSSFQICQTSRNV